MQPEEGAIRIERFLADQPNFRRHRIEAAEIGDLPQLLTTQGDLRTLPCHLGEIGGMDGFFAARLRKLD